MSEPAYIEPVQERSIATKERLLAALEKLLRTHSIHDLTVSVIASEAGVTTGAIYRRFKDKQALLQAASERAHEDATTAKKLDESVTSNDEALIREMLLGILNYAFTHMALMRATAAMNDDVSFTHMQAARNEVASSLARNLKNSAYSGEELERRARFVLRTATAAIRDTYMSGPGGYDCSLSPAEFQRRNRKSVSNLIDNLLEMSTVYLGVSN